MKIVICGDTHFGAVFGLGGPNGRGGNSRVDDYKNSFSEIINYCIENEVDIFIQTGDLFDTRNPSSDLIKIVDSEIKRLSDANISSFLMMGNHDYKKTKTGFSSSLENLSCSDFPGCRVLIKPDSIVVEKNGESVGLVLFPYRDKRMYDTNECKLSSLKYNSHVKGLVEQVSFCSKKVFVGHNFFYEGSYNAYGGSEILANQTMFGDVDLCVMGHLHEFRKVRDIPLSYYSGSMERINFGDKNVKKYFIEYDTLRGISKPVQVKSRDLFDGSLSVLTKDDLSELDNHINKLDLSNKIVRLNLTVDELLMAAINIQDIKKRLYESGAYYVSKVRLSIRKSKNKNKKIVNLNSKSDIEIFTEYLSSFDLSEDDKKKMGGIMKSIIN